MTSLLDEPAWHKPLTHSAKAVDRSTVQRWLDAYVAAWQSYEPDAIAELWSEDAVWHYPVRDRRDGPGCDRGGMDGGTR